MPVYNVEKYIDRALKSLANQKNKNFKLLIINDGSTDQTLAKVEAYRSQFESFEVITKPNGGLSSSRNLGMSKVDTPYFTFHDGDDWVDAGFVDFFVDAFAKHDVDMVCCGFWIDPKGKKAGKPGYGYLSRKEAMLSLTNIFSSVKGYTWNKGYKTRIVRQNKMEFVSDLAFMEDQIFNVKYLSLSEGFYYTSKPYYHYFQRSDSMVHDLNPKKIPDNFRANYRVWDGIIKTLVRDADEQKKAASAAKKIAKDQNQNESLIWWGVPKFGLVASSA